MMVTIPRRIPPHARPARWLAKFAVLASVAACAAPDPGGEPTPEQIAARNPLDDGHNQFFSPNPNFVAQPADFAIKRSSLSREGEILVVEGDAETVTVGGPGSFGITDANQFAIVREVLAEYPDEFDTIQIYTSFIDDAHQGRAYYQGIRSSVAGIGIAGFNSRGNWGLDPDEGRLSGFSNMNSMLMWGNGSFNGLNSIEGYYHGVIAHELSHRWLFKMRFTDTNGNANESLLGRDDAHWSRLAHAYGSVHDGNFFVANGNGTFRNDGTDLGFAPLDLYAMGRLPAEQVEDFFYLVEATMDGMMLNKLSNIPRGGVVAGRPVTVTMSQVVDAMGPRNPPFGFDSPYYRAAFVLVTAPGEARDSWAPHLAKLQEVQADFPETWRRWTGGGMCTKVTARCPEPVMGLAGYAVSDGGDDIAAPGEQVGIRLSAINTGLGLAEGATVRLVAASDTVTVDTTEAKAVPAVAAGEAVDVADAFQVTISSTIACAEAVQLTAVFTTEQGPTFSESFSVNVGTTVLKSDPLNEAPNWTVDPDNRDNALRGQWELGEPDLVTVLGFVTQPGEDHTPGDGKLSFHTGIPRGDFFADNDLDGGTTTLESPVFAIGDAVDPILTFYAWRMAGDFTVSGGPGPVPGTDLIVQASNDGGDTFVELGRVTENTTEWTRVAFRIRDAVEPGNRMRFRFVITDDSEVGNVEVGIDDLEIVDFVEGCDIDVPDPNPNPNPNPKPPPPDEGGCRGLGPDSGPEGVLSLLLMVAFAAFIRRRR